MKADLSFPHAHLARLRVESAEGILSAGFVLELLGVAVGLLLVAAGGSFVVWYWAAFVLTIPFAARWLDRRAERGDNTLELDRLAKTVTRIFRSHSESKNVAFRELPLYEFNRQGNVWFTAQLVCAEGVVRLVDLREKEEIRRMGEAMAHWLDIPLVDKGPGGSDAARAPLL